MEDEQLSDEVTKYMYNNRDELIGTLQYNKATNEIIERQITTYNPRKRKLTIKTYIPDIVLDEAYNREWKEQVKHIFQRSTLLCEVTTFFDAKNNPTKKRTRRAALFGQSAIYHIYTIPMGESKAAQISAYIAINK